MTKITQVLHLVSLISFAFGKEESNGARKAISFIDTNDSKGVLKMEPQVTKSASSSFVYDDEKETVYIAGSSHEGCSVTSFQLSDFSSASRELSDMRDCSKMVSNKIIAGHSQHDLAVHVSDLNDGQPILLFSGKAHSEHVAVVTARNDPHQLYAATMESDAVEQHRKFSSIRLHNLQDGSNHEFHTTEDHDVHLSNMVMFQDKLLMVGYTKGWGAAFGGERVSKTSYYDNAFVTRLDTNGNVLQTVRIGKKLYNNEILNVCSSADDKELYVVGTTDAILDPAMPRSRIDGSSFAFLAKLDTESLEPVWIRQIGAAAGKNYKPQGVWSGPEATGLVCAAYGENVFMAGTLLHGSVLNLPGEFASKGGNDAFVTQFDSSGNMCFAQQIGSDLDEKMEDLVIDKDGSAILLGSRGDNEETFVLKLLHRDDCWLQLHEDGEWRRNCNIDQALI